MDNNDFQDVSRLLKVISQAHRLRILWSCLDSALSVRELMHVLEEPSQSLVSHHLKQLRDANLISARRDGKRMLNACCIKSPMNVFAVLFKIFRSFALR